MKKFYFVIFTVLLLIFILVGCEKTVNKKTEISMFHWDFSIDKNSDIYKYLSDNYKIEIKAINAPWSEWFSVLSTSAAAGDLPDVFITYGPGDSDFYEKIVKDGLVEPIDKYFDKYPNLKNLLSDKDNFKTNGIYYSLPVTSELDHTFMIRQDWLDELNLNIPTTTEELYNVALKIKNTYNITPIVSSPTHTSGFFWLNPIFFAFGGRWEGYVEEKNKIIPAWISEGNKDAIKYIKKLYSNGLLDKEFFMTSDDNKKEKFLNSNAAIMMHNEYNSIKEELYKNNSNAKLSVFNILKGPNNEKGMWTMDHFFTAVSVKANLPQEKKDKIFELLDFLYSSEGKTMLRYGIKNTTYKIIDNKYINLIEKNKNLIEVDKTASLRSFVEMGDVWIPDWNPNKEIIEEIINSNISLGKSNKYLYNKTESEIKYEKKLYDLTMQNYLKLLNSDNFDIDWNNFVVEFLKLGGQEIINERNKN